MATSSQGTDWGEEPMEMNENPEVEASVFRSRIETHREFLEERMDPDFGLLDHLRANKGISFRQFQEISAEKVSYKKSQMIIDSILQGTGPEKIAKFRDALKGTKQEHIVNFVIGDGEYKSQFGGNWPLGEAKVDILDDNITFLTENIDSVSGLLTCMIQKRAITQRQMETISVHQEPCKRNEVLLEIIRRGSQAEFEGTIQALRASNQDLIAEVLVHGGMVLSVHSKAESNLPTIGPAEEIIVQQIDEILQDRSPEESRQLLEAYLTLKTSGLIAAMRKKSIVFFFHCKNQQQLRRLLEQLVTEELQKTIELIYNKVISTSSIVRVKVTWNVEEFNKAERKLEEIEEAKPVVEKRVQSTGIEGGDVFLADATQAAEPETAEELVEAEDRRQKLSITTFEQIEEVRVLSDEDTNAAILRNNTDFLNQHIRPRGVIDKLHAAEILSDEDTRYIKTLRHVSEKNDEMLNVIRNASTENYKKFVSYLRDSGQTLVADVVEKGGVVMKLKVTHEPTDNLEEIEKEIVDRLNQLQDKNVSKSEEVWRFMSQLKRANLEIVSSRLDKGVILWCWCHSQTALRTLDDISMSDTKQPNLLNGLFSLLLSGKNAPMISSVYLENPEKDVVCRKHKGILSEKKFPTGERQAFGVAILRTKICLLCRNPNAIVVYEEGDLEKASEDEMSLDDITTPMDMAYSKESNCLYITDEGKASVWKVAISSSEKQIDLWLDGGAGDPFTLSVTNDGSVVMVKRGSQSSLDIYDSETRLLLRLVLPTSISLPNHAVETSKGSFVVSYGEYVGGPGGVCEITKEGQIISRFDSNFDSINGVAENVNKLLAHIAKTKFFGFNYLAIDENDQVFACHCENGAVAVFDSRLFLLEDGKSGLTVPHRLQYFKEQTQLVVTHGPQKNIVSILGLLLK